MAFNGGNTTIFTSTGAIQTFTVAISGYYNLLSFGGQGGGNNAGGLGAKVEGVVLLKAGTVLNIVVAGKGLPAPDTPGGYASGGGGTFIYTNLGELLEAAGGGGGSGFAGNAGGAGLAGTSGGTGSQVNGGIAGLGGANGNGGQGGQTVTIGPNPTKFNGGGGAGWLSNGGDGVGQEPGSGGKTAPTFVGGTGYSGGENGGFGGGGGGSYDGGGGGGGYSGGGGGAGNQGGGNNGGGGGGSYIIASATSQTLQSGVRSGAGEVGITFISAYNTIPSNITINNLNLTNTILTNKTVFNSVAGDYCAINVISGGGYCGNINNLITINDLVTLSNPTLKSSGLLSNGEQILPECVLSANIINSFIKPIANSIHYCFAAGLTNNSNLTLFNDYTVTPYLTDCVVINTLKNCIANVDINSFGGIVISGVGVSVNGLNTNNYLIASGGGTYTCGPGNIKMALVGGNAIVQGGSGIDTVIMQGQKYTPIAMNTTINNLITTTQIYTDQGVSTMTNVEYLQFDDQTVAIGVGAGQNAGQAYRLYQSALNRTPDQGGLINWIKQLDSGASIVSVANSFINSAEFVKSYGNNLSNSALVNALYANVLHRAPDAAGANYWLAALQNSASRAEVLVNFSESAENVSNVAALIASGIPVGDYRLVA